MFVYCNLLLDVFFSNNVLFIIQTSLHFLFTFVFVLTRVRTNVFFHRSMFVLVAQHFSCAEERAFGYFL